MNAAERIALGKHLRLIGGRCHQPRKDRMRSGLWLEFRRGMSLRIGQFPATRGVHLILASLGVAWRRIGVLALVAYFSSSSFQLVWTWISSPADLMIQVTSLCVSSSHTVVLIGKCYPEGVGIQPCRQSKSVRLFTNCPSVLRRGRRTQVSNAGHLLLLTMTRLCSNPSRWRGCSVCCEWTPRYGLCTVKRSKGFSKVLALEYLLQKQLTLRASVG
jgi:hypothetical protein